MSCEDLGLAFVGSGFSEVNCTSNPDAGGCSCEAQVDQTGGLGHVSPSFSTQGEFQVAAAELTLNGGEEISYIFARSPSFLVVSHTGNTLLPTVGSVVLVPAD